MIHSYVPCRIGETTLECRSVGNGPPVVFVHGAHIADSFEPLFHQPALRDHFRLVSYHRQGFAGSQRIPARTTVSSQVADLIGLLDFLGISKAAVVGHSFGGVIALELALERPDLVTALALMEPALRGLLPGGPRAFADALAPILQLRASGDAAAAVQLHLETVAGPSYQSILDAAAPGSLAQAIADADTFFMSDFPGLLAWHCDGARLSQISAPILYFLGGASGQTYRQSQAFVSAWLPATRVVIIDGALHCLQLEQPKVVAEALSIFLWSVLSST